MVSSRNLDEEFDDNSTRNYQYKFDQLIREKLIARWLCHVDISKASLEMGSFDGSMTSQLLEHLPEIDVVEGSKQLCEIVRDRFEGRARVHHAFFEDFSPTNSYRQIFLVHGLEHLDAPESVLERASTWLEEDGVMFIAVPNANALSRLLAVEMGIVESPESVTEGERLHGHRTTFTQETLREVVESAGMRVIEEGGVILKTLANFQFDLALDHEIIDEAYVAACDTLSRKFPEFSSSIFVVASKTRLSS